MVKNPAIIVAAGLIACASLLFIATSNADEVTKPESDLAEAAERALKATEAEFGAGRADVEDRYQWSRRLMEAKLASGDVAAREDHLERMRELHRQTEARFKAGAVGGSAQAYAATTYYVLEAETAQHDTL